MDDWSGFVLTFGQLHDFLDSIKPDGIAVELAPDCIVVTHCRPKDGKFSPAHRVVPRIYFAVPPAQHKNMYVPEPKLAEFQMAIGVTREHLEAFLR